MIIAIDGKSGAGKTTLMLCLAKRFKLQYLDTGKIYRACVINLFNLLDSDGTSDKDIDDVIAHNPELIVKAAENVVSDDLNHPDIIKESIGKIASKISTLGEVRDTLTNMQRDFARNYDTSAFNGSVLCGRDIGSVILPKADFKLFIDADIEVRAQRRYTELRFKEIERSYNDILEMLKQRDIRDINRDVAPLVALPEAKKFDTTNVTIEQMCDMAVDYINTSKTRSA